MHEVAVTDVKQPLVVGLDRRVKLNQDPPSLLSRRASASCGVSILRAQPHLSRPLSQVLMDGAIGWLSRSARARPAGFMPAVVAPRDHGAHGDNRDPSD